MAGELSIDSECTGIRLKIETKVRFMKRYAKESESFAAALGNFLDQLVADVVLTRQEVDYISDRIKNNYDKRMAKRLTRMPGHPNGSDAKASRKKKETK